MRAPDSEDPWRDPARVSAKRSLALMVLGAVAGLMLAGYALFTARGTSTLVVPPEDVALVNQQPISRSDYLIQLQTLFGTDLAHATREQRKKVLDDMIREELFVQRGKELDVASTDPEVRSAMVNAVELEISQDAITSQPSESALRDYYAAHRERYATEGVMTVRDLVFPRDPAVLGAAREALKTHPMTPALPAQLRGADSGKTGPEEFYFAAKIHLGDRLFEAARTLADGDFSPDIPLDDGVHILYMEKNVRPTQSTFSAVRDQVLSDFRNDAIAHWRMGDESFLRKRANVLISDDVR